MTGILNLRAISTAWLATVLIYRNRVPEAAKLLSDDISFAEPGKSGIYPAIHFGIAQAMTAAASGRNESALFAADEAVRLARKHSERGHLARGLLSRAVIRWVTTPADCEPVRRDLDEASRIALELKMTPTQRDVARIVEDIEQREKEHAQSLRPNNAICDPSSTRFKICSYTLN